MPRLATQSKCHSHVLIGLLALALVSIALPALSDEAGLPGKDSARPPLKDAGLDGEATAYFHFDDLLPGAPVAHDVYGLLGLFIGTGPFGSTGVVMTSMWSPDLHVAGPCDGTAALRTDPFVGPSIKFVIPEGTTSFAMDVGDYGPSDDDAIQVCAFADTELSDRIGCTQAWMPYGHETQCLPLRYQSEDRVIRSILVTSSSDQGPTPNSFYVDNLFIDGFCLEASVVPFDQDNALWGSMPHAGTDGDLARYGAEVTSLAMLLSSVGEGEGFSITPGELETWLRAQQDGFIGPHVNPFVLSRLATLSGLDLGYHGMFRHGESDEIFSAALCRYGMPVVMTLDTADGDAGDHTVLALEYDTEESPASWRIEDPASRATHLGDDGYPDAFHQFIDFKPGEAPPALGVAFEGADRALVVDPSGQRSGFDESLGRELDEIYNMRHLWRALTDASAVVPAERWTQLYIERFAPDPGSYCVKPQSDTLRSLRATFLAYDGLGFGSAEEIVFEEGPETRPTFIVEVPDALGAAPTVNLFENRAPESSATDVPPKECTSPDGVPVRLIVSEWNDPDCDLVTHTWTGPFPEGGGEVEGQPVTVTMPLGTHDVDLVTDDGLLSSDPSRVEIVVQDTTPPRGKITFPADLQCVAESATITDSFQDVCDEELTRTYVPGPGPTYDEEGAHFVTLEVLDASGNRAGDQRAFIVDKTAPSVAVLAPQMEQEVPRVEPIGHYLASDDEDAAPGGVIAERILVDGCLVLDGATYGDGDGLLHDEQFEVTGPLLCLAYDACGQTVFADSLFSVEAEDCAGNLGSAGDVIEGTYTVNELDCD